MSAILVVFQLGSAQHLTIHHISVGQGDATLFQLSNGKAVLIDAGNTSSGKDVVLPYLQRLAITSLDVVVASHYHSDHIGGLDEVIYGLSPDSIRLTLDRGIIPPLPSTSAFLQYLAAAEKCPRNAQVVLGQMIHLSENIVLQSLAVNGAIFNRSGIRARGANENSLSIAWLLSYSQSIDSNLFTFRYFTGGDCGGPGGPDTDLETPLAALVGDVDAMKLNHHGSRYSTSQAFLDSLQPEAVVLSVGDQNPYSHPSQETLDRLQLSPSVRYIYQTGSGSGATTPKVKILGPIAIALFDSFYTIATDTFQLSSTVPGTNASRSGDTKKQGRSTGIGHDREEQ